MTCNGCLTLAHAVLGRPSPQSIQLASATSRASSFWTERLRQSEPDLQRLHPLLAFRRVEMRIQLRRLRAEVPYPFGNLLPRQAIRHADRDRLPGVGVVWGERAG